MRIITLSSLIILLTTLILNFEHHTDNAFAQVTDLTQINSIKFFNVNMPATTIVGKDFTLSGVMVADTDQTLDHVYLTIQSSGQLWIYGDQTIDMKSFVGGVTQKNFSFKLRPTEPGTTQITLTAVGVQNTYGVEVRGTTTVTSTAISTLDQTQESTQLAFTNVNIPANIVSGQTISIPYTLINKGALVAHDIFITLSAPNGILTKGDSVNNIGNLYPGENVSSAFKMVAIDAGSYKIDLNAYSSNNPVSTLPITITVADSVSNVAVTSVTTAPSYLYPGDISDRMNVIVTNFGQEDLRGITLHLLLPEGMRFSWSGYGSFVFPYLPSAKNFPYAVEQAATFYVDIDKAIQPGTQILGLSFTGNNLNYTTHVPITIAPKARFDLQNVTYSTSTVLGTQTQNSLSPGITTVVRATLKNTGTAPADSVVGILQVSNDFQGIKNAGVINVGVLDRAGVILPNQIFHTTFTLDVDPTSQSGVYPGTIAINWQQGQLPGNFTQSVPLSIPVTPTPVFYSLPYLQIFLGGTSVLFLFLYLLSRRKKIPKEQDKQTPI